MAKLFSGVATFGGPTPRGLKGAQWGKKVDRTPRQGFITAFDVCLLIPKSGFEIPYELEN